MYGIIWYTDLDDRTLLIDEENDQYVKRMIIDEEKEFGFYRQAEEKGDGKVLYSDHNTIEVTLNIKEVIRSQKGKEEEIWKVKSMNDKECAEFKKLTEEDQVLLNCWKNEGKTLQERYSEWNNRILSIKKKCVKIRKSKKGKFRTRPIKKLMNQKRKIRKQMKEVTNEKEQKEMVDMQRILSQHINQREKDIQRGRRKK